MTSNAARTDRDEQALDVLRDIWSANAQSADELEEQLRANRPKVCRNMRSIGFGGMDPETVSPGEATNTPVDTDIRSAWREKLEEEGKLHPQGVSVAELLDTAGEPRADG